MKKVIGPVLITPHAAVRALQRGITIQMINHVLSCGRCICIMPTGVYKYTAKCGSKYKVTVVMDPDNTIIITCYKRMQAANKFW